MYDDDDDDDDDDEGGAIGSSKSVKGEADRGIDLDLFQATTLSDVWVQNTDIVVNIYSCLS